MTRNRDRTRSGMRGKKRGGGIRKEERETYRTTVMITKTKKKTVLALEE